jgi:DNA-binding HxlR family transcriptional regulator
MPAKEVSCLVEKTLGVIGGRWKVLVLEQLLDGPRRFNELHRALVGVTHKTLTQQLREMQSDGIIHRELFAQIPPKVEYSLTVLGKTLKPVLQAMHEWARQHGKDLPKRRVWNPG